MFDFINRKTFFAGSNLSPLTVIITITLQLQSFNASAYTEDMSCAGCNLSSTNQEGLDFEKPEICGARRNYLEPFLNELKDLDSDGYYTQTRDLEIASETLPRKCVLYTMRSFWKDHGLTSAEKRVSDMLYNVTAPFTQYKTILPAGEHPSDPALYARCERFPIHKPVRDLNKACVTEDYVNIVYNSLLDVSECLKVPAKFIIPKLANESGLHLNAFGLVNDGGIGQFTEQALKDVKQNYQAKYQEIMRSQSPACQRLRSIPGALVQNPAEIQTSDEDRCHAIAAPANPIRSLVYYAIFYHATKRNADSAWKMTRDESGRTADNLLRELYLDDESTLTDEEIEIQNKKINKIKQMLFVMSYNAGPRPPVVAFLKWLNYREKIAHRYPIRDADFNMNFWPDKSVSSAKKGQERIDAFAEFKKKSIRNSVSLRANPPLTLAEYLFAVYDSKYIVLVKAQANKLNKVMGQDVCVEKDFLEL